MGLINAKRDKEKDYPNHIVPVWKALKELVDTGTWAVRVYNWEDEKKFEYVPNTKIVRTICNDVLAEIRIESAFPQVEESKTFNLNEPGPLIEQLAVFRISAVVFEGWGGREARRTIRQEHINLKVKVRLDEYTTLEQMRTDPELHLKKDSRAKFESELRHRLANALDTVTLSATIALKEAKEKNLDTKSLFINSTVFDDEWRF